MVVGKVRAAPYKRQQRLKMAASTQSSSSPPLTQSSPTSPPLDGSSQQQETVKTSFRPAPYLMFSTLFPLNTSGSKEVLVGLDPSDRTFTPRVQIFAKRPRGRYGVSLLVNEWTELMRSEATISSYFEGGPPPKSLDFGGFSGSFLIIYGQPTLVICERSPEHSYSPDTIAVQSSTWQGLLSAKSCINEALSVVGYSVPTVTQRFNTLENYVMDHLRHAVTNEDATDSELTTLLTSFLREFKHNEPEFHFIDCTVALYCIPLYVNGFHMRQYVNNFM